MAFVLMQVKTRFDTPIFNCFSLFLCKSGMISIIYHKYDKSFTEIIPISSSYSMILSLIDCPYFCDSAMKNCVFIFEKNLLFTRH